MALIDNVTNAYHCDEASGNIIDAASTDDGINDGADYGATGKLGDALGFVRANLDDVVFPSGITGDTTATVMGWVFSTSTVGQQKVIRANATDGSDHGFIFGIYQGDFRTLTPGIAWGTTGTNAGDSVWHSFMLTRNGDDLALYFDGNSSPISTNSGANSATGYGSDMVWGNENTNAFDGRIDEVVVFSVIKSTADFATFHNGGDGIAYPFSAGVTRKIKIAGTFQDKPIKTKVGGTFVDKPIKIKVGGTFQDA